MPLNERFEINYAQYLPEVVVIPIEQVVENLFSGTFETRKVDLVFRYIVQSGYRFSQKDMAPLRIPIEKIYRKESLINGLTFAHLFAWRGYRFSITDLLMLGNHKTDLGDTVAHFMAYAGHIFTLEELIELKNPSNSMNLTVAHQMAVREYRFSVGELLALKNTFPPDSWSIPLHMARDGYQFSQSEIEQLGNPRDKNTKRTLEEEWNESVVRQANNRADLERVKYSLEFEGGSPIFYIHDYWSEKKSKRITIDFGFFSTLGDRFFGVNKFAIEIRYNGSGFQLDIEEISCDAPFHQLAQTVLINGLVQELRNAISAGQAFDFTSIIQDFSDTCSEFEISGYGGFGEVEIN